MDIVSEDDYKNFMVNFLIFKKKKDFSPICRIITTVNLKKGHSLVVWQTIYIENIGIEADRQARAKLSVESLQFL